MSQATAEKHPPMGVEFTSGSIPRHLIAFSIPMLMGNLVQTAYNIVNSVWVGNGLGKEALAAMTVSFPVFFLLMAVAGGITQATSILAAQAYGARDHDTVRRTIQNSLLMTVLVAGFCLAAGIWGTDPILRVMNTTADVFPQAASYLHVFLWTIPFMFGLFLMASALRAVGDSRTPLKFQATALVVTAILDPVLMFGWLGLPRFGLNGTAIATIICQGVAMVALARSLIRKKHIAAPDLRGFRFDPHLCWLILKIGIPTMLQQALISIGMVIMISLVNGFGSTAAAAFGAAMRIDQFAFLPAMTFGMAVATLAGQNIGAGKMERVGPVFWWGVALSCSLTGIATLLAVVAPELILRLFTQDPEVIAAGAVYLRIVGPSYLLFTVMFVCNGVINGAGHTFVTTLISFLAQWGVRLPLAVFLSRRLNSVEGVWYGLSAGFGTGMVLSLGYYLSGRWKKGIRSPHPIHRPPLDVVSKTSEGL